MFITRCLQSDGITPAHARSFYERLWALHIDSRRLDMTKKEHGGTGIAKPVVPFQDRLRAGMFIRASKSQLQGAREASRVVMLMCPEGTMLSTAKGAHKFPSRRNGNWVDGRYICALVKAATLKGAFEVELQRQIVITVGDMEEELAMEYDATTRYYFLATLDPR
jgi:kinesin family protein 2/24